MADEDDEHSRYYTPLEAYGIRSMQAEPLPLTRNITVAIDATKRNIRIRMKDNTTCSFPQLKRTINTRSAVLGHM